MQRRRPLGRTRLKAADTARERRLSAFREDALQAAGIYPQEAEIFLRARGNVAGMKEFLDGEDWKQERKELLHSLSDKDFRDLDPEIAQEQLRQLAPLYPAVQKRAGIRKTAGHCFSAESFRALLSLPPHRQGRTDCLCVGGESIFSEQERAVFSERPERIWEWEQTHLRYLPQEDYDTLKITPPAALRGLWADETGKRALFVAVCRTLGIPARLNPVTGQAEYLTGNGWREVSGQAEAAGGGAEETFTDRGRSARKLLPI